MARKPRPIHTERVYHVFNRGNYKRPIFVEEGALEAFAKTLDETIENHGWEVYAYAIMPNHYHLCIRTPQGDLSEGMHRLLTRFCVRFNRLKKEEGHVFQGRFHAKVAPSGISVRRIIDYIHLNPARAGLFSIERLRLSGCTSLTAYLDAGERGRLAVSTAWERFLGYPDTEEGRQAYLLALTNAYLDDPKGDKFEREWKEALKEELAEAKTMSRGAPGPIRAELRKSSAERTQEREVRWEEWAKESMQRIGLTEESLPGLAKSDPLKLEVARRLKAREVNCSWIAKRLCAGTGASLRARLSED